MWSSSKLYRLSCRVDGFANWALLWRCVSTRHCSVSNPWLSFAYARCTLFWIWISVQACFGDTNLHILFLTYMRFSYMFSQDFSQTLICTTLPKRIREKFSRVFVGAYDFYGTHITSKPVLFLLVNQFHQCWLPILNFHICVKYFYSQLLHISHAITYQNEQTTA